MLKKMPPLDVFTDEPPQPLGSIGRELWDRMLGDRDLPSERERELLYRACVATQLEAELRAEIERDGPVVVSKTGRMTEHPAIRPQLHYAAQAVSALDKLKPPGSGSPGRPAGSWRFNDDD